MIKQMNPLYEGIVQAYGELAELAGRILTNPDLTRDERAELAHWNDSYLTQFEQALRCKPEIYHHVIEERFVPETGLAHLVTNSEN